MWVSSLKNALSQHTFNTFNTSASDMTKNFIFLIKMSSKHLCRLINGVFDLHGDYHPLEIFHDLPNKIRLWPEIYPKDDRFTLTRCSDNFKTARPHRLWSSVLSFGLCDLLVICLKRVENMVNNIRYSLGKNQRNPYIMLEHNPCPFLQRVVQLLYQQ